MKKKIKVKVKCKNCNTNFYFTKWRLKYNPQFCSPGCSTSFRNKKEPEQRICKNCGRVELVVPSLASRKFCGRKCMGEYFSKNYIGKKSPKYNHSKNLVKECKNCGKEFRVQRYEIGQKTCSLKCGQRNRNMVGNRNPNWKGGNVAVNCVVCDKEYYVRPSTVETTKCCSYKCLGIYSKSRMPNKDTKIEKIIEEWLIDNNIKFEKQKVIRGICISDFTVGNKIIFCDGDYWHNLPKAIKRDRWVNKKLKENGYEIIRLWEHEIHAGKRPNI